MDRLCDTPPDPQAAIGGPPPLSCLQVDPEEPFFYTVASNLHRVSTLSRDQHLALWKRVLDLYSQTGIGLPEFLRGLCQESFVESLMENEVFWAMAGQHGARACYAQATELLSAVYATAALVAAWKDRLPLAREDAVLLADPG